MIAALRFEDRWKLRNARGNVGWAGLDSGAKVGQAISKHGGRIMMVNRAAIALGGLCIGLAVAQPRAGFAAGDDQALLQNDSAFLQAVGKSDKAAVGKVLADGFTWIDSQGATVSKTEALTALPKTPLTGDDSDARAHIYGDVGVVTSHRGNVYGLRIWAKTGGNWQMLDFHEVTLAPPATSTAPEVLSCENPCTT